MSERIAKYEVVEKIAEGGFGVVYKARDPFIKRLVAIKTCSVADEEMARRFYREAEIAGRFDHPNVTIVHDFGVEDQMAYLVQEYLSGEDLLQKIRRRDPLPLRQKVDYLRQVAAGLGYAHSQQVIHRDIKPANLRVLESGQVKILDFGIAKLATATTQLTQKGMAVGTLGYLSPEQLRDQELDTRTDIFSYGVVAYELLTYARPFQGRQLSALMDEILHGKPVAVSLLVPDCPPILERVVHRCLEKDRERRYQSFDEVIADLEEVRRELTGKEAVMATATPAAATAGAPAEGGPVTRPIPLPPQPAPIATSEPSPPVAAAPPPLAAPSPSAVTVSSAALPPPPPTAPAGATVVVGPTAPAPARTAAPPPPSILADAPTMMTPQWPSPPPPPPTASASPMPVPPQPPDASAKTPSASPPPPPPAPTVMMAGGLADAASPEAAAATLAALMEPLREVPASPPPKASEAPKATPPSDARGRLPWIGIAAGGAALVLVLLAGGWLLLRLWHRAPSAAPASATPLPSAAPAAPTVATVTVLGAPWGVLESLRTAEGRELPLPAQRETPLVLDLPPGHYVATLRHPAATATGSCEVDAVAGQPATCRAELIVPDALQYFKEAGWWR